MTTDSNTSLVSHSSAITTGLYGAGHTSSDNPTTPRAQLSTHISTNSIGTTQTTSKPLKLNQSTATDEITEAITSSEGNTK